MSPTTPQTRSNAGIDLGIGHPSPSLLPIELIRRATDESVRSGDRLLLQYGAEQGDPGFRERLTGFLGAEHGETAPPLEQFMITGGVSAALDLICSLYTSPGDAVVVEEPTYFLALRIFQDHGLRIVSVPIDEQGIEIESFEETVARVRPRLAYIIPYHQNPTGTCLSPARRRALVEAAERSKTVLLSDEVYSLLTYTDVMPPLTVAGGSEWVLSLGSFSKILGPGMRLGWLHAAPEHIERLTQSGVLDSGGGYSPFGGAIIRSALERGLLPGHIDALRHAYLRRRDLLFERLVPLEQEGWHVSKPTGGYFIWLTGPPGFDAGERLSAAANQGVRYVPGSRFSAAGTGTASLRVSFSFCDEADLTRGGERLAQVLRESE